MPRFSFRFHGLPCVALLLNWIALVSPLPAQPGSAPILFPLRTMADFRAPIGGWRIAGGLGGDPRRQNVFTLEDGDGVLISNPAMSPGTPLVTTWEHADLLLDFDFLLSPGASFNVWLQGRYPVGFTANESGRIGLADGRAPAAEAGRAAGLWQHARIEFMAPRFDAANAKISAARFSKITINDFVVQEDVAVTLASSGAVGVGEAAAGPLAFRSEGGPLAIRRIAYRSSGPGQVQVSELAYRLYSGEFKRLGDYDSVSPKTSGRADRFSQAAVEKSGRYALVFTGTLQVPQAGSYVFSAESTDAVKLTIDDRAVLNTPEKNGATGTVVMAAGAHHFRLDYLRLTTSGRPAFELGVSGPGIGWQLLTSPDSSVSRPPPPVLKIDPTNRVLVQRGFVPFEPRKRLYAISVGTPQGVHYAYDLETTALLRVWRGRFLDTGEMWVNRGENQYAKAAGPALTLSGLPSVALIEMPQSGGWPDRPDPLMTPQGYTLEPDGQPVFLTKLTDVLIKDRIAPSADGHALARRMEFSGALPSWQVCVLLADADVITPQPDGSGWIIGDRGYYLDWPKDSPHQPVLRNRGGRQLLVVPLTKATLGKPLNYEIVW